MDLPKLKRQLQHLFLPHESNNHRAKVLHHSSLLLLIVALFVTSGLFSFTAKHDQAVLGISYSITPDELLAQTNAKRAENGLPPLTMDSSLATAATRKAADMFAKNYWAHIAPDGTTPWYFIRDSGYEYVYAGENLARGFTSSADVVNAWMASPSHRENLLSPNYKDIGFAIQEGTLTGDETVLVVQEFGSRTRSVASANTEPIEAPTPTPTVVFITPTPQFVARVIATPTPTPVITEAPTPTPVITAPPIANVQVAAFKNDPLINMPAAQKNIALFIVGGILVLLCLDIIIINRKNVVRILSHNLDHIIFFAMLLLVILLLTKGGVL